jgi:hypothetical protein
MRALFGKVKGVAVTLNGNTWTDHDVPVPGGGPAVFAAAAIPLSDNNGNGTPPSGASPDPAARNPRGKGDEASATQPGILLKADGNGRSSIGARLAGSLPFLHWHEHSLLTAPAARKSKPRC